MSGQPPHLPFVDPARPVADAVGGPPRTARRDHRPPGGSRPRRRDRRARRRPAGRGRGGGARGPAARRRDGGGRDRRSGRDRAGWSGCGSSISPAACGGCSGPRTCRGCGSCSTTTPSHRALGLTEVGDHTEVADPGARTERSSPVRRGAEPVTQRPALPGSRALAPERACPSGRWSPLWARLHRRDERAGVRGAVLAQHGAARPPDRRGAGLVGRCDVHAGRRPARPVGRRQPGDRGVGGGARRELHRRGHARSSAAASRCGPSRRPGRRDRRPRSR